MKEKRIDPPYKTYLVSDDGTRTRVDAHRIVIELGPDVELALELAPHPGRVPVGTADNSPAIYRWVMGATILKSR